MKNSISQTQMIKLYSFSLFLAFLLISNSAYCQFDSLFTDVESQVVSWVAPVRRILNVFFGVGILALGVSIVYKLQGEDRGGLRPHIIGIVSCILVIIIVNVIASKLLTA